MNLLGPQGALPKFSWRPRECVLLRGGTSTPEAPTDPKMSSCNRLTSLPMYYLVRVGKVTLLHVLQLLQLMSAKSARDLQSRRRKASSHVLHWQSLNCNQG